ncbi:hypothetical protein KKG08_03105 [Patescibacteria group bacterium]|nr:hypothetical protein [Patescibacteria group bacterium]
MRNIFYCILLVFISKKVFAKDVYFDFSVKEPFVESGSEFEVKFNYKFDGFEEKDFLVNPVVDRGLVKYRNNGLSDVFPISLIGFGNISLSFDVWNLKTGDIYKTPIKPIWSTLVYSRYLEKLNTNLRSFMNAKIDR